MTTTPTPASKIERGNFKFRGYRPNFISGSDAPPQDEFNTLAELLALEWVDRFQREGFSGFAFDVAHKVYGSDCPAEHALMATYKDGAEWWVVGFVSGEGVQQIGLPKWEAGKPGFIPAPKVEPISHDSQGNPQYARGDYRPGIVGGSEA